MEIHSWLRQTSAYAETADGYQHLQGVLHGKDVYMIVVESLEQVVIGLEVDGQEVTPNINALLDQSIVFDNVAQQTRDGNTSDAELMILAGMYPLDSGSAFLKYPDNTFPVTLPRLLRNVGYRTLALHGDEATFWNREAVFANMGFGDYFSEEDFSATPQIGMGVADSALFDEVLQAQTLSPGRTFMMVSTITSHLPWVIPQGLRGLTLTRDDDLTAMYLQSIHYVEQEFGRFYRSLHESGDLSNSVFVILGDHEGIHKYDPGTWLPDNHRRLPFIGHVPGIEGEVVENAGGQVDILPTMAAMMGIPESEYAGRVMGRNLLGAHTGSAIDSLGVGTNGVTPDPLLADAFQISNLALQGDYFASQ